MSGLVKNKFSIGGLKGVHFSRYTSGGYTSVFEVIRTISSLFFLFFFFFLQKNFKRTKMQIKPKPTNKTKTSKQKTTEATIFCAQKLLRGGNYLFCVLVLF